MITLGLTGSIGMGKTTTAGMLRDLGIPVHDSDAAVHELLADGGAAEKAVLNAFPELISSPVDRKKLGEIVFHDSVRREVLEAILHPLVRVSQMEFIKHHQEQGADIIVLDIPLLYETGAQTRVDYVIVVTAPREIQHLRVMARKGMTEDKFKAILARQMPDEEKCAKADFIVQTGFGMEKAMEQVREIIAGLKKD
jgi:dephospho-CoA kinase